MFASDWVVPDHRNPTPIVDEAEPQHETITRPDYFADV